MGTGYVSHYQENDPVRWWEFPRKQEYEAVDIKQHDILEFIEDYEMRASNGRECPKGTIVVATGPALAGPGNFVAYRKLNGIIGSCYTRRVKVQQGTWQKVTDVATQVVQGSTLVRPIMELHGGGVQGVAETFAKHAVYVAQPTRYTASIGLRANDMAGAYTWGPAVFERWVPGVDVAAAAAAQPFLLGTRVRLTANYASLPQGTEGIVELGDGHGQNTVQFPGYGTYHPYTNVLEAVEPPALNDGNDRSRAMNFATALGFVKRFHDLGVLVAVRQRSWDKASLYAAIDEKDSQGRNVNKLYTAPAVEARLRELSTSQVPTDVIATTSGLCFKFLVPGTLNTYIPAPDGASMWRLDEVQAAKSITWFGGKKYRLCKEVITRTIEPFVQA